MPFFVYILYSASRDRYYIGSCENVNVRLQQHNTGRNLSTKYGLPWDLKKIEEYNSLQEARQREAFIKRMKSRKFIKKIIDNER